MHRRGRRTCHAAAWPPVGADPAGTARAGERHRAVAAPRTARCPSVAARRLPAAARRWEAVPGTARCPGGVVRYGAARQGMAAPGTARCPGAVARCAPAVRGMGRCRPAAARRGAAVRRMGRCRGAVARRGRTAVPAAGRQCVGDGPVPSRGASRVGPVRADGGPPRAGGSPGAATPPGGGPAAGGHGPPGGAAARATPVRPSRRPSVDKSRVRRGRRALARARTLRLVSRRPPGRLRIRLAARLLVGAPTRRTHGASVSS